jgi:hypothetical protein
MRRLLILLLLFAALTVSAADEPWFPDQYQAHSCAADTFCNAFPASQMSSAAMRYLGLSLDGKWIAAHDAEMRAEFAPMCRKIGTCYSMPGTTASFCNDVVARDMRNTCGRKWTKGSKDFEQCAAYVEIFTIGIDQFGRDAWRAAQACANPKNEPAAKSDVAPRWSISPAKIPRSYAGDIIVLAHDQTTNIPVRGRIAIENQQVWSRANPEGVPAPFYPFKWPIKYVRVPNAAGHRDVVAPIATMTFDNYPEIKFRLPVDPPKMVIEMQPAKLRRGKNKVTIKANDAETGAPVEARVMMGDRTLGDTNIPFELELKKGQKRGEIWLTSLFDAYCDVVVLPAEK